MENWFPPSDVTKNCKKRREVQDTILNIIEEEGGLPPGIMLPVLKFNELSHFEDQYYDPSSDEEEIEGEEEFLEEDEEEFLEEEGEFSYPEGYIECDRENEDGLSDQREYYGEMADNEEWTEDQQDHVDIGENFNSE